MLDSSLADKQFCYTGTTQRYVDSSQTLLPPGHPNAYPTPYATTMTLEHGQVLNFELC